MNNALRGDFALHVNNYGDVPFVGSLPVEAGVVSDNGRDVRSVALSSDASVTEASQATAITNGSGITVSHQLTLPYDGQTGNFTVGQVITGGTSGAQGTILADTDGGASGTLVLELVEGVFEDDETITGSSYRICCGK